MGISEFHRDERRFRLPNDQSLDLLNSQETIFPQPYVTTIYFGGPEDFLHGIALKLRFFSDGPNTKPFILQEKQMGILELKLGPKLNDSSIRRKKFRTEIPLLHAFSILENTENFAELSRYKLKDSDKPFPSSLLHAICERENIPGFIPHGATSYHRSHFQSGSSRLTLDRNITYWGIIRFYKDWYVIPIGKDKQGIVIEFKTSPFTANEESPKALNGFHEATKTSAKFFGLKELVNSGQPIVIINPEMTGSLEEGNWDLVEREFKLDLSRNARQTIEDMEFDPENYSFSRVYESTSHQQFIIIGENDICIMGEGGRNKPDVIKVKTRIPGDKGILVRRELIVPYSEEALREAVVNAGGEINQSYKRTPFFVRKRVQRNILCRNTGNIFNIFIDSCEAENEVRKPLFQCEVEYHGNLTLGLNRNPAHTQIDNDFVEIRNILIAFFLSQDIRSTVSQTTKYEWIKGQQ